MDDSAKRVGSIAFSVIILIVWLALRAERCKRETEYNDYSYNYTPPSLYTPSTDYQGTLDRAKTALEELMAKDTSWKPAVEAIDPFMIASNPKYTQCQALDAVIEQEPTWQVEVSDYVLANGDTKPGVKAPYPLYVLHRDDSIPASSPEVIARSEVMIQKLMDGSTPTAPSLTTTDLLIQTGYMPKPVKGQKKLKGAIAPGTPIVKAWMYDHRSKRIVCAGVRAIPDAGKKDDSDSVIMLSDAQLVKLVQDVPSALKSVPELEDVIMVEEPAPKKKK